MDVVNDIIAKRRSWVEARRREGGHDVFRATVSALPTPPSLHDALLVSRAEHSVVASVCAETLVARGGDERLLGALISRVTEAGASAIMVSVNDGGNGSGFEGVLSAMQATPLPIICKDVVIDPMQITMARAHGAAAVVLSASFLNDKAMKALRREATDMMMEVVYDVSRVSHVDAISKIRQDRAASVDCRLWSGDIFDVNGQNSERFRERFSAVVPEFSLGLIPVEQTTDVENLHRWTQTSSGVLLVDVSTPDFDRAEELVAVAAGGARV